MRNCFPRSKYPNKELITTASRKRAIKITWSVFPRKCHVLLLAHLSFAQGELLWSPFVRRPSSVVMSPNAANKSGPLVIVAPITKVVRGKIHFHEILLPKGTAGLKFESKVKVFQLRCVDKNRLSKSKIGFIPNESINKLDENIRIVTGLY